MKFQKLKASSTPQAHLDAVAYEGQPPENRRFLAGYQHHLENLFVMTPNNASHTEGMNRRTLNALAFQLRIEGWVKNPLADDKFERIIVGMEDPVQEDGSLKEGVELLVAKWGKGYSSPIHGHADGMLHENLLYGKIRVNTYRIVSETERKVRLQESQIFESNGSGDLVEIVSKYMRSILPHERANLVHNFDVLEPSATFHYVAEHTRDGRDNGYELELFSFNLNEIENRLSAREAYYSQVGDVILVRSTNVPDYGDHFILITGHPIPKPHGMRPQDIAYYAPNMTNFLDKHEVENGLILLKLKDTTASRFREFHGNPLHKIQH